jgi:hypothetical protein
MNKCLKVGLFFSMFQNPFSVPTGKQLPETRQRLPKNNGSLHSFPHVPLELIMML